MPQSSKLARRVRFPLPAPSSPPHQSSDFHFFYRRVPELRFRRFTCHEMPCSALPSLESVTLYVTPCGIGGKPAGSRPTAGMASSGLNRVAHGQLPVRTRGRLNKLPPHPLKFAAQRGSGTVDQSQNHVANMLWQTFPFGDHTCQFRAHHVEVLWAHFCAPAMNRFAGA